jgi:hypothetical protein
MNLADSVCETNNWTAKVTKKLSTEHNRKSLVDEISNSYQCFL